MTQGLPYLRASVDHGVGYDAAIAGEADSGSMVAALDLAAFATLGGSTNRRVVSKVSSA